MAKRLAGLSLVGFRRPQQLTQWPQVAAHRFMLRRNMNPSLKRDQARSLS
jgi:hypothetical protein